MLGELSKKYLNMTVELISNPQANHAFNLINRDQSTSIFKPEEWNEDVLVVDAWLRTVHTKKEFIFENFRLNSLLGQGLKKLPIGQKLDFANQNAVPSAIGNTNEANNTHNSFLEFIKNLAFKV
jgi:hypothetical protein